MGRRDARAYIEQVVLDVRQPLGVGRVEILDRERHSELRIELVDGSVRLDPGVRLGDPAHVAEVGLAAVAEACVDAGEVDGPASPRIRRRYDGIIRGRW